MKAALRRAQSAHPNFFWDDLLPEVRFGLNVAVSSVHGYSPFEAVFK